MSFHCSRFNSHNYTKKIYKEPPNFRKPKTTPTVLLKEKFVPYTFPLRKVKEEKLVTKDQNEFHVIVCLYMLFIHNFQCNMQF